MAALAEQRLAVFRGLPGLFAHGGEQIGEGSGASILFPVLHAPACGICPVMHPRPAFTASLRRYLSLQNSRLCALCPDPIFLVERSHPVFRLWRNSVIYGVLRAGLTPRSVSTSVNRIGGRIFGCQIPWLSDST